MISPKAGQRSPHEFGQIYTSNKLSVNDCEGWRVGLDTLLIESKLWALIQWHWCVSKGFIDIHGWLCVHHHK